MPKYTIQVQAQFEVEAPNFEEACDEAVSQAMDMESTMWATIDIGVDQNADYKVAPVASTDCASGDHKACDGEESALWPDGTFSMRKCSCVCHVAVSNG